MKINEITGIVVDSAMDVHKALGPGLLESAYEECLCHELRARKMPFQRQYPLPVVYKDHRLDCGYRIDILVYGLVVVELKAVDHVLPIHDAQLMTYMRLGNWTVGLLINFNVAYLKQGIHRRVFNFDENLEVPAPSASLR